MASHIRRLFCHKSRKEIAQKKFTYVYTVGMILKLTSLTSVFGVKLFPCMANELHDIRLENHIYGSSLWAEPSCFTTLRSTERKLLESFFIEVVAEWRFFSILFYSEANQNDWIR